MTRGAPAAGEIFRCTSESICPGGPPGTCASGRDVQAVACSSCFSLAQNADRDLNRKVIFASTRVPYNTRPPLGSPGRAWGSYFTTASTVSQL